MATTAIVNPRGDGTGFNVEVRGSDGTIYVGTLAAQERRSRDFEREADDLGEGMDDSSNSSSRSSSNMNDDNYLDDSSLRGNYAVADPVVLKGLENSYKSSSIGSDSRYNSSSNFFSNPSTNQSFLDTDTQMMEATSNKGGRKRRTKGKGKRTKRGGRSKGKRTKRRY